MRSAKPINIETCCSKLCLSSSKTGLRFRWKAFICRYSHVEGVPMTNLRPFSVKDTLGETSSKRFEG